MLFGLSRRHAPHGLSPCAEEIQIDVVDIGEDNQTTRTDLAGEQARRQVLIDHRFNPGQTPRAELEQEREFRAFFPGCEMGAERLPGVRPVPGALWH